MISLKPGIFLGCSETGQRCSLQLPLLLQACYTIPVNTVVSISEVSTTLDGGF